ncbi:MAG: hypothetical protein ABL974_00555 [Prosthecobacter sp.]
MNHFSLNLNQMLTASLSACCLLSSCAQTLEKIDTGWRVADPSGHHRYHRDRYYKHERKVGIRLPGDAGR